VWCDDGREVLKLERVSALPLPLRLWPVAGASRSIVIVTTDLRPRHHFGNIRDHHPTTTKSLRASHAQPPRLAHAKSAMCSGYWDPGRACSLLLLGTAVAGPSYTTLGTCSTRKGSDQALREGDDCAIDENCCIR
jgi:hypothetical protein